MVVHQEIFNRNLLAPRQLKQVLAAEFIAQRLGAEPA